MAMPNSRVTSYPYICQIHDIGPDYLVLEYVEGKSLSSPLPEREDKPAQLQTSPPLEKIVKRCLEKQPSARCQGMLEIKIDLEKIPEERGSSSADEQKQSMVFPR